MAIDFEKEVHKIADMVEVPGYTVHPDTIAIATEVLEEIDQKYGPESADPKSYHSAPHGLDVSRRGVRVTNILYPYLKPVQRRRIFDLAILDGASHDFERNLGPLLNEQASIEHLIDKINATAGPLNSPTFKRRLYLGTLATVANIYDDGRVTQPNLRRGSHDPVKFIVAFGDINGIAMEGKVRMLKDATNLCFEIFGEPSDEEYYDFLVGQAAFVKQRLNDKQVKADIAYYFPDKVEAVYADLRRAYHKNIVSAYGLALKFGETPGMQFLTSKALRQVGMANRAMLPDVLARVLGGKNSRDH